MKKEISLLEKIKMIDEVKKTFEKQIEKRLSLTKVGSPLFVRKDSGLQDDLSGSEKAVGFAREGETFEVVHSLAKWKRYALGKYGFSPYTGLYTDMKAIRKEEELDEVHSMYVEQWDWEKVILKSDRTTDYLKETVRSIYKALRQTCIIMKKKYAFLSTELPKSVHFITSGDLLDMYPDKCAKERERLITKKYGAVFIMQIGDKLKDGTVHDLRSPDYDDWSLDGDLLIWDKAIDREIEITSMGIRVDEESLVSQLKKAGAMERMEYPFHKMLIDKKLPYTIGGGIGQSRVLMLILGVKHICEVQQSSYTKKYEKMIKDYQIL
ncbi:MAG: aspartate--ammonia ligase [bacterium]|nr:aspartate--ammonia ligase [bacterium]